MLVVLRTTGVSQTMWLLGDQIRDWSVALRPFGELPLSGPPSVAGGNSLGPIFYWIMWAIRVTVGPWFDNLPHAAVVGTAILHAAADVALFFAVRHVTESATLALAVILLTVTSAYDLALTATIWNPQVAVILLKLAMSMMLVYGQRASRPLMAATVAVAWLSVQAHSSAVLVSVPLIGWFVVRDVFARRWRELAQTVRIIAEVILVLQIPYVVDRMSSGAAQGGPTMLVQAVKTVVADPLSARPGMSFRAISERLEYLWAMPFEASWLPALLLVSAGAATWFARHRPHVLFVTALPLLAAVAGFSGWTFIFDTYWFFGLSPAVAVMLACAVCVLPDGRARSAGALAALAVVLYMQPVRLVVTRDIHRLPEYAPWVEGSRATARRTMEVRAISTAFELPPSSDPSFPFRCLGGRLEADAPFDAVIARDGSVSFRAAE